MVGQKFRIGSPDDTKVFAIWQTELKINQLKKKTTHTIRNVVYRKISKQQFAIAFLASYNFKSRRAQSSECSPPALGYFIVG